MPWGNQNDVGSQLETHFGVQTMNRQILPPRIPPPPSRPTFVAGGPKRAASRDVIFLFLGTLLGIPAGMFSNYMYDWVFPREPTVIEQVGVQGLAGPIDGYYFMGSKRDKTKRDGWIDVRYAMGTQAEKYKCDVSVSELELFEIVRFERGCRRVVFRFKNPDLLSAKWNQVNSAVNLSVTITSEKGQLWEGSQGVAFAYYRDL